MKKDSKTKIAKTYALALFEAAKENKCVGKVYEDVDKLKALMKDNNEFSDYMENPLWGSDDKYDVLKKTAKVLNLKEETLNCLEVVVSNGRFAELSLILDGFQKIYYKDQGIIEVDVETVKGLSVSQDKKLKTVLSKLFAGNVVVNYMINPSILGGLRIRSGSKMFDDTLETKLNYLENMMKGK